MIYNSKPDAINRNTPCIPNSQFDILKYLLVSFWAYKKYPMAARIEVTNAALTKRSPKNPIMKS